jgi:hypothetical protein
MRLKVILNLLQATQASVCQLGKLTEKHLVQPVSRHAWKVQCKHFQSHQCLAIRANLGFEGQ